MAWLLVHANDVSATDLAALPLAPVMTPVTVNDFSAFENLINLINLHHSYANTSTVSTITIFNALQDVIDGVKTADDLETELSSLYAWDKEQLKALVEIPNYLNLVLTPPATSDLKNIRILVRLYKCFSPWHCLA